MSMPWGTIQDSGFRIQEAESRSHSVGALLVAAAIRGYQRWISPYKGYVCAHRQLHGGLSCSEFARQRVLTQGVSGAIGSIRGQFRECRDAAQYLRQRRRERLLAAAAASEHAGAVAMAKGRSRGRTIDERIYEEGEKKRKRLNELPGDNPWWVGPEWWDTCGIGNDCAGPGCVGALLGDLMCSPTDR